MLFVLTGTGMETLQDRAVYADADHRHAVTVGRKRCVTPCQPGVGAEDGERVAPPSTGAARSVTRDGRRCGWVRRDHVGTCVLLLKPDQHE